MNKTLMLMRHAKSDWSSGITNDFDRPLNARGKTDAKKMARYMFEQGMRPDKVLSSPATRAKETASYIKSALKLDDSIVEYDAKLYMGVPGETLNIISDNLKHHDALLLVSHNPLLDQLLSIFWRNSELPYTSTGKLVTTANILVIELSGVLELCVSELNIVSKTVLRPKEISV